MGKIEVGSVAGHHFHGQADLQVAYHVSCGARKGYLMKRRRLVNRQAFMYDPSMGWETDIWFDWEAEGRDD